MPVNFCHHNLGDRLLSVLLCSPCDTYCCSEDVSPPAPPSRSGDAPHRFTPTGRCSPTPRYSTPPLAGGSEVLVITQGFCYLVQHRNIDIVMLAVWLCVCVFWGLAGFLRVIFWSCSMGPKDLRNIKIVLCRAETSVQQPQDDSSIFGINQNKHSMILGKTCTCLTHQNIIS